MSINGKFLCKLWLIPRILFILFYSLLFSLNNVTWTFFHTSTSLLLTIALFYFKTAIYYFTMLMYHDLFNHCQSRAHRLFPVFDYCREKLYSRTSFVSKLIHCKETIFINWPSIQWHIKCIFLFNLHNNLLWNGCFTDEKIVVGKCLENSSSLPWSQSW